MDSFSNEASGGPAKLVRAAVPLVSLGSFAGNPPAIAGSVTASTPLQVMNQVDITGFDSYDISMFCRNVSPGTALAPITTQVNLQWFNDLSGIPVFQETWYIWNGRAVPGDVYSTVVGCGPMHGRYMSVTLFVPSNCTSDVIAQFINIYGSNRRVPYSDWRQNGQGTNPQVNGISIFQGGGTGLDNILASITGASVSVNTFVFVPLGLFAGPVWYRFQSSSGVPSNDPVIAEVAATLGGVWTPGTGMSGVLANIPADTNEHSGQIVLPRAPCAFLIKAGGASSVTFSLEVAAMQTA